MPSTERLHGTIPIVTPSLSSFPVAAVALQMFGVRSRYRTPLGQSLPDKDTPAITETSRSSVTHKHVPPLTAVRPVVGTRRLKLEKCLAFFVRKPMFAAREIPHVNVNSLAQRPTSMSELNSGSIADHTLTISDPSENVSVALSAVALNNAPKQLGPYEILREVGRGAMGTVYEAKHAQLERQVALKVLPPDLATSPKRLKRFRREMAAVGRLDHPNIVLATDAGELDGLCYIAMQFVDGPDLEQVLEEIGRFEPADACEIIRQTALGLEHIGQQKLVHRDIKPSNILLTRTGQAKITDLGIAMLRNAEQLETSMTLVGSMMGTPDYIAPEQITQCTGVDIRADIYSLGCTLYCLLSGKSPFNGPGYTTLTAKLLAHANKTPPSLAEAHAEIPEGIIALVEQMMSKEADDRPSTPAEVAELIAPFCSGADLVPVATGQRKGARLKPLNLPTAVDSEEASNNKSKAKQDAQKEQSFFGNRSTKKIVYGAAAAAGLTGVLWLGSTGASSNGQQNVLVANKDLKAQVGQAQAMLANVNNSITESAEINLRTSQQLSMVLSDMQKQFARRQEESGLQSVALRNPQSPVDHYYNACLFSKMGDHENAKNSFMAYFADELPVVDPHLQFVALLKVREGVQGAQAIYNSLPGDREFVGRKLALAMLEPKQPIEALEQVIANHPDCSPAVYLLSQHFAAESNQRATLSQRRRQRELLHQFVSLHEQGHLLPYFLDQNIPAGQLETAHQQLNELNESAAAPNRVPVEAMTLQERGGHWRIAVRIDEAASEIFWAIGEDSEFESTGHASGVISHHSRTEKIRPNQFFEISKRELAQADEDSKIYVKYTDASGAMQGPYELDVDLQASSIARKQNSLEMNSHSWARFEGDKLHFRLFQLRSRNIIEAVHYSLDDKVPTLSMPVPDENLSVHNLKDFYLPVDESVEYVSLQVTFTDGKKTKVVKIFRN